MDAEEKEEGRGGDEVDEGLGGASRAGRLLMRDAFRSAATSTTICRESNIKGTFYSPSPDITISSLRAGISTTDSPTAGVPGLSEALLVNRR